MKKPNFSKTVTAISISITLVTFCAAIYASFKGYDTSVYMYAIPSSVTFSGAAIIFYFRKAQIENALYIWLTLIKELTALKKEYGDSPESMEFVEQSISNAENKVSCAIENYADEAMSPVDNNL